VWSFNTGARDVTPPSITSRYPDIDATEVPLSANIIVTFSEEMNPATVVAANFTLTGPYGPVAWDALTYDGANYEVTLYPQVCCCHRPLHCHRRRRRDRLAGLAVPAGQRTWSFTTEAEPEMFAYQATSTITPPTLTARARRSRPLPAPLPTGWTSWRSPTTRTP